MCELSAGIFCQFYKNHLHCDLKFNNMSNKLSQRKTKMSSTTFVKALLRCQWASNLSEVPDDYIQDRFNLYDLPTLDLHCGKLALSLVSGHFTISGEKLCDDDCIHNTDGANFDDEDFQKYLWKLAIRTYFFIHQRWMQTPDGQRTAQFRLQRCLYGACRQKDCIGRGVLPGVSPKSTSIMNNPLIKYCPRCNTTVECGDERNMGDAFGHNFIANYLMSYPYSCAPKTVLEHRISGFRVHSSAFDRHRPSLP